MNESANVLRSEAIDGRTTLWFEHQKLIRSRETTKTYSSSNPNEKGENFDK